MAQTPEMVNAEARRVLEDAGFVWDARLGTWVNRKLRRAIAFESVRDRPLAWLRGWVEAATAKPDTPVPRTKRPKP